MKIARDFMVRVPLLKYDEKATRARQVLRDDVYRELYVHDGRRRLMGCVDISGVLNVTATRSNVTIEGFIKEVSPVGPDSSIDTVAKTIRENGTDSIPVVDEGGQVLGGVLLSEIFPVIITRHRLGGLVEEYMSRKVVECPADEPIHRIHTLITESGFSAFPVVKKKRLVGIISRRDLLRDGRWRVSAEGASSTPVAGVMTTPVITVSPGESVQKAAEMLVRHDISRLPVVLGDELIGIIDRHDVLNAIPD
ncbi:MAG: Inosine-5'-monophosphate dehydrogenase [Methanoregulaceae archaeon PtaB.Bin009]|jgi:CBS domain-containing protein|nr:MAG: Inosine-5'-monophosphate dehydrogenase [Methanoregulaceae archaeon PtaB.Bin009]OPY39827.1 MAG: Inosine-5'-monophosphate dehydrogenase [Methanoregulaceae archaeon PtaU1.Bin066]HNQ29770.1 CBS domain-containing protein [Methanolinea sp.]